MNGSLSCYELRLKAGYEDVAAVCCDVATEIDDTFPGLEYPIVSNREGRDRSGPPSRQRQGRKWRGDAGVSSVSAPNERALRETARDMLST